MRLTSELHPSQLEPQRLATIAGPFWVPEAKAVSPLMYLQAPSYDALLTPYVLPLTAYRLPLTTYHSPLTTYHFYSPRTT
jgi:hypothetical protein